MTHFKITPDNRLDNRNAEEVARSLYSYSTPLARMEKWKIKKPSYISFETVLENENTQFFLTVPNGDSDLTKKVLATAWPNSAIEEVNDPFTETPIVCTSLNLQRHFMFALKVDRRKVGCLSGLLETSKNLDAGEKVYIQTMATPAHPSWFTDATEAYEQFNKGEMPRKVRFNKKEIQLSTLRLATRTVYGAASLVSEIIGGEPLEPLKIDGSERAMLLRSGSLSEATKAKAKGEAYEAEVRIGVICSNKEKAEKLLRMVVSAFRELDGDNMLVANPKDNKWFDKMKNRKLFSFFYNDYYSIGEISRFHLLPSGDLQDKFKVPNINKLEIEPSESLRSGGLYLGVVEVKKKSVKVYQDVSDHDILCLPRVVIGGMGSGKTKGYAANFMVQANINGFGALAIDPAKGEIGKEVSAALPSEKVTIIQLGTTPISLDWREVERSPKAKNRLANTILGFFNTSNEEAGAQTARYIRAAVMAMSTGRLSEIMQIFEDEEYRNARIETMNESIHKTTLLQFNKESDAMKNRILSPIYNRLDIILGDQYLSECMDSKNGIDMVELMEQKKAFIINVPKSDLGPEAVDLIVNLLSSKLDLAMTLRSEEKQDPFFVLFDEPHQFLKSAKTWKAAAVESRKWRLGYVWLFHSWEQIPKDLSEIIKAAGPHYTLYNSSKKTFKDLAEEITPYTVEDGIKLKRWHAINILRAGSEIQKPFICHMALPPSEKNP